MIPGGYRKENYPYKVSFNQAPIYFNTWVLTSHYVPGILKVITDSCATPTFLITCVDANSGMAHPPARFSLLYYFPETTLRFLCGLIATSLSSYPCYPLSSTSQLLKKKLWENIKEETIRKKYVPYVQNQETTKLRRLLAVHRIKDSYSKCMYTSQK